MKEIIFATNNAHKLEEIQTILKDKCKLLSLSDIGFSGEIPETADSLQENARMKASYIYDLFHKDCFADDTGLEIEALDGRPGVYSARYAGPACIAEDNMRKVLQEIEGNSNRKARFVSVISLILEGRVYQFEGIAEGEIITDRRGGAGFGYDPIFIPKGYDQTFAEMPLSLKNTISHRAKAVKKLTDFLAIT